MDRMTTRNSLGRAILKNALLCGRCNEAMWAPITEVGEDVADRLAAYEDTGLEPEEIETVMALAEKMNVVDLVRENLRLANKLRHTEIALKTATEKYEVAEAEGHLIVLPCTVGDTVWRTGDRFPAEIESILIDEDGIFFNYVEYDRSYEITETWDEGAFEIADIGFSVFLTREEEEEPTEGGERNDAD